MSSSTWLEAPEDPPEDGWYWHTWAAEMDVRCCYVTADQVLLGGRGMPMPWSKFAKGELDSARERPEADGVLR